MTEKSVFDGLQGEGRTITKTRSPDGEVHANDRYLRSFDVDACPLRKAGYGVGRMTKDLLESKNIGIKVVEKLHLDGNKVAVLQTDPMHFEGKSDSGYIQIWVDTKRWLAVKQICFHRKDPSRSFKPSRQIKCEQFVHVAERLWLPSHIHLWSWNSDADGNVWKGEESHFAYEGWEILKELPENQFALEFTVDAPTSDN